MNKMKAKTFTPTALLAGSLFAALLCAPDLASAQAPASTSYQAVVRNNGGIPMANSAITVRFTIRSGSGSGTMVYRETQGLNTDEFGLFSANVGEGTSSIGNYNTVTWNSNDHFLQVEVDAGGGFDDLGAVELTSVPYSFYARTSEKALDMALGELNNVDNAAPSNGQVLKWNGSEWAPAADNSGSGSLWTANGSDVYYDQGRVAIGMTTPNSAMNVHSNSAETNIKLSNSTSGNTLLDGLAIRSVNTDGAIRNYESGYLDLGTNGGVQMSLAPNGSVGIDELIPQAGLHLSDDKELRIDMQTADPEPNSFYGNSGPIGYGQMGGGAGGTTIYNDYGITSCVYLSQGSYVVTLDNSWNGSATAIVTAYQAGSPKWATANPTVDGNIVTVALYDQAGNPINGDFNIVVFGTPE